ncbi:MAG TPA: outer membrane lipoprotein-sorting protein [Candidatus Acidoferrum sp.]|nr:outer membrane lipoprotein-sorting protein [Candidatus Acidoferrum sp.]
MIRLFIRAGSIPAFVAAFLAAISIPATPQTKGPVLAADQVINKVIDARTTSGSRVHARLMRTSGGPDAAKGKDTRQLLIKTTRDGEKTKTLYQILWPAEYLGDSILIEDSGDHHPKGFLYQKKVATPLTSQMLEAPFFGSDLLIEDVIEDFWYWPSRRLAGEEVVDKRQCIIIELRPGPDSATQYSMVKVWVAPEISLPLKVQFFARDGKLVKTVTTDRVVKEGKVWLAATMKIQPAGSKSQTVLEGTKSERDLQLPSGDFTLDAIKDFAKGGR